jgi:hypothetical protein
LTSPREPHTSIRRHEAGRADGALTAPATRRRFAAEPIQHNGRVGRNLLDSERTDQAAARIRASFGSFAA